MTKEIIEDITASYDHIAVISACAKVTELKKEMLGIQIIEPDHMFFKTK